MNKIEKTGMIIAMAGLLGLLGFAMIALIMIVLGYGHEKPPVWVDQYLAGCVLVLLPGAIVWLIGITKDI